MGGHRSPFGSIVSWEDFHSLSNEIPLFIKYDVDSLTHPISFEEVCSAVWFLHPHKAPGPDGLSMIFYRSCWHIIKKDLVRMIIWTQSKDKIGGATNSTFLALIPEEKNPTTIKRYRPISLCNSYKILSKFPIE